MWELIEGVAREVVGLPMDDRGFLLGDGVFETFRIVDGKIRHADLHAASLEAACRALALVMPDRAGIEAAIADVSSAGAEGVGKLIVSRGKGGRGLSPIIDPASRVFLQVFETPPKPDTVQLLTVDIRRSATSLAACHKTLSYADNLAARRETVAHGGDMALLLTETGFVSGCDSANIFWRANGKVFTPSQRCGIRNGVMRRRVMQWLKDAGQAVIECEAEAGMLNTATAVWITNALTGVTAVTRLDEQLFQTNDALLQKLSAADL
ncbi:MAG: 4-amino-4-deoxychorismate lyase [Hyphobacterium sp.]|nr:MAG: 4-amino-4-deoxychorismate lyase [Hyphobacterium sp.]